MGFDGYEKSGGFHYKIKHTGIAALLEPCVENPHIFGLCIPNGMMKTYIENFNSMSEKLQEFVIKRHTKCWGCNFCIQTDKTGKRPKAYIPTVYKQQTYNLCLRFSGYAYGFSHIDDELAGQLIEMLTFMDNFSDIFLKFVLQFVRRFDKIAFAVRLDMPEWRNW